MANELVLVTGAAGGQQGKTGRHLSEMLLARGVPVRAFVHKSDERSDRLRALGAEVVEGDFLDFPSVQHAVEHLSQLWRSLRTAPAHFQVTKTIETLGGREPKTFDEFVREQQSAFNGSNS